MRFPTRVTLVAASNPCPCGAGETARATAPPPISRATAAGSSGPLLDRIDVSVTVGRPSAAALRDPERAADGHVRRRILAARERQTVRLAETGLTCNAQLSARLLRELPADVRGPAALYELHDRNRLSARGHGRILRVARTIADLAAFGRGPPDHVLQAASLRLDDQSLRGAPPRCERGGTRAARRRPAAPSRHALGTLRPAADRRPGPRRAGLRRRPATTACGVRPWWPRSPGLLDVEWRRRSAPPRVLSLPDAALIALDPPVGRAPLRGLLAGPRARDRRCGPGRRCRCAPAYPERCVSSPTRPPCWHVAGRPGARVEPAVAVVGARRGRVRARGRARARRGLRAAGVPCSGDGDGRRLGRPLGALERRRPRRWPCSRAAPTSRIRPRKRGLHAARGRARLRRVRAAAGLHRLPLVLRRAQPPDRRPGRAHRSSSRRPSGRARSRPPTSPRSSAARCARCPVP